MEQKVRLHSSRQWVGEPVIIEKGYAEVEFFTFSEMAVDERGMVNNNFLLAPAEYAATLAVNENFLFVEKMEIDFLLPVRIGERIRATARLTEEKDHIYKVKVEIYRFEELAARGIFYIKKYEKHLLPSF